jgi:hypothetical protein
VTPPAREPKSSYQRTYGHLVEMKDNGRPQQIARSELRG